MNTLALTHFSRSSRFRSAALTALAAGGLLVAGLTHTPSAHAQPVYANVSIGVQPAPIYLQSAPPAPMYEMQPPMPFRGAVWIAGSYIWNNGWVWSPGRWERPQRGYHWRAPYYAANPGGGVVYVPGYWGSPNRPFVPPMARPMHRDDREYDRPMYRDDRGYGRPEMHDHRYPSREQRSLQNRGEYEQRHRDGDRR